MNDDFDYLAAFEPIRQLVPRDEPVAQKMRTLIAACEADYPHADWAAFSELPFDQELPKLTSWLRNKFDGRTPEKPLRALWFGLFNPVDADHGVVADFDMCGSSSYDPKDETFVWAADPDYVPEGSRACSEVLARLYTHAYRADESLGNIAEYPLALGYTAFAIADVFKGSNAFPGGVEAVAIAVGFNSGDGLVIGRLMPHGFVPVNNAA